MKSFVFSLFLLSGCISIPTHEHAIRDAHLKEIAYATALAKQVEGGLITPEEMINLLGSQKDLVDMRWPER